MASPTRSPFTGRDLEALRRRGLAAEEARAQLERIRRGPLPIALRRPATVGDGLLRAEGREERWALAARAGAEAGRITWFVPASGAATRMFRDLIHALEHPERLRTSATAGGSKERRAAQRLLDELPRLALAPALASALAVRGRSLERLRAERDALPILEALLAEDGLDFARFPKALLPFHREGDAVLTPIEEHLVEGTEIVRDAGGVCRLHFTVSPEHLDRVRGFTRERAAAIAARAGARLELGFSSQDPATDCLAATPEGEPFRDAGGELLLRPGGHGALLANLAGCGAELAFLKNVDNVAAAPFKAPTYRWARAVIGCLVEIQSQTFRLLERLDDPADASAVEEALAFATDVLHRTGGRRAAGDPRAAARALLDRPLRVCGMVPNAGEPGGGPFWVSGPGDEASLQIVEGAQVSADQRPVFESATHFNPVFMGCALRDRHDRPYDLARFVDPDAAIVTRKTEGARTLIALERPGLWNGGMAGWNTVFLEVPIEVFHPVKAVFDLLRPAHQPARMPDPGPI